MVDTNGTTTLGYDELYRQNAVTYPNGDTQSYTYDPMGNRLTKVNNTVTTNCTNDDADQMTAAGGVTYGYDNNNGNQTSRGTDTFGYNAENRLTSTNLSGTSGSYVYNGDGLRTSRTIGGTTTTFAWGNANGMPVILRDSLANKYLYGLDLISVTDTGNHQFYFHTDGLGSTTAITNSSGTVVKTYQYDVFGAIRVQTGTQPNEFTFTGEQVDSSGLEYLRARFYDNATGRFLSRDPLPLQQRYPYAGNNAVNLVDPYGLFPCPGCGLVTRVVETTWNGAVDYVGGAEVGVLYVTGAATVAVGRAGYNDLQNPRNIPKDVQTVSLTGVILTCGESPVLPLAGACGVSGALYAVSSGVRIAMAHGAHARVCYSATTALGLTELLWGKVVSLLADSTDALCEPGQALADQQQSSLARGPSKE